MDVESFFFSFFFSLKDKLGETYMSGLGPTCKEGAKLRTVVENRFFKTKLTSKKIRHICPSCLKAYVIER